jgi:hypothetical protein
MSEFLFDVKLFSCIRVQAATEAEARAKLAQMLDVVDVQLSDPDDNDETLTFEASIDGEADLLEVDGEGV